MSTSRSILLSKSFTEFHASIGYECGDIWFRKLGFWQRYWLTYLSRGGDRHTRGGVTRLPKHIEKALLLLCKGECDRRWAARISMT